MTSTRRRKLKKTAVVDPGGKDFLTEAEMKCFLHAARGGRHGTRDFAMMFMTYRHGLRVSELIDLRLKDIDLKTARFYVRRKKGSLSTHQPIEGDELRALRAWLRIREQRADAHSTYLFLSERGPMTRQAVNYLVRETGKRAAISFSYAAAVSNELSCVASLGCNRNIHAAYASWFTFSGLDPNSPFTAVIRPETGA